MKKENFAVFRWVFEVYKHFRRPMAIMFIFVFVLQILTLLSPYLWGKMINALYLRVSWMDTVVFAVLSVLLHELRVCIQQAKNRFESNKFDYRPQVILLDKVFRKTLGFSIGQHINTHSGIKQSVISRGVHSLMSLAYSCAYEIIPDFIRLILSIVFIFFVNIYIGFMLLVGVFAFIFVTFFINKKFNKKVSRMHKLWRDEDKFESEILRNVSLIQIHAQEERILTELNRDLNGLRRYGTLLWKRFDVAAFFRNQITIVVQGALMIYGAYLVFNGSMLPGALIMIFSWSQDVFGRLESFGRMQRNIMDMYVAVKKLHGLVHIDPEVKNAKNPRFPIFTGDISFENVSFSYPIRKETDSKEGDEKKELQEKEVLKNVSFSIKNGQTIAVVGPSGAGKSTIVHLLMRAYDPKSGSIKVDGIDLKDVDTTYYRQNIGHVEQEVCLFDQTLRYNMTFGLNGRARYITEEDMHAVAKKSRIDQFLNTLEKGFDTMIGEKGVFLSGGQKQRVGIARALIKNPNILVFDEATSNLDSENEKIIQESIDEVSKGKTTIIIAHRFSTIRSADKILVFDEGFLVGEGTHNELLISCKKYKELLENQIK